MNVPHDLFIDGEWTPASDGARLDVIDPATEEAIDSVPIATDADVDRALGAAEAAGRRWREVDAWSRSRVLRRAADLVRERAEAIALVLTGEQGKPLREARAEVAGAADQFDWYADEARRIYGRVVDGHDRDTRLVVVRQPVGPVAALSPWNFPALLPMRKVAPALAAGCSVVLKPAEEAPRTALLLAACCQDAGLPPGVLNVVTGVPDRISTRLIRSPVIRKVSFTGSVPIGRRIGALCAEEVKPVSLELGGHSPVLVFEDADVDAAARACATGKFRNMGQVCVAASRFYVEEPIYDAFVARFREVAAALRLGDGRTPTTDVGPLSNQRRVLAVEALISDAIDRGATVACGGRRSPLFPRGFFFEPTVLTGVDAGMRVMREEPFGPVAPIAPFRDLAHALALANATDYGLAAYVFTRSIRTAFLAGEGLDAGIVGVNHLAVAAAELPFGGVKQSGFGREGGSEGIDAYTVTKYLSIRL